VLHGTAASRSAFCLPALLVRLPLRFGGMFPHPLQFFILLSGSGRTGRNLVRLGHILMILRFNPHSNHLLCFLSDLRFKKFGATAHMQNFSIPARLEAPLMQRPPNPIGLMAAKLSANTSHRIKMPVPAVNI
jgi:hypothetical protein